MSARRQPGTRYEYNATFGHMATWTHTYRSKRDGTRRMVWDHVSCSMDPSGTWRVSDGGIACPAEVYFAQAQQ